MATIPVGYYNATFVYRAVGADRDATWSIGISDLSVAPAEDPSAVAVQLEGAVLLATGICAGSFLGLDWTFLGVSVALQTIDGPIVGESMTGVAGAGAAAQIPLNGAILVRKVTALGGRRNRGRLFMPPVYPAEGLVDALGNLNVAAVANLQGRFDDLLIRMAAADLDPILFHSEAPFTPTRINGLVVQPLIATQRRRMRR